MKDMRLECGVAGSANCCLGDWLTDTEYNTSAITSKGSLFLYRIPTVYNHKFLKTALLNKPFQAPHVSTTSNWARKPSRQDIARAMNKSVENSRRRMGDDRGVWRRHRGSSIVMEGITRPVRLPIAFYLLRFPNNETFT